MATQIRPADAALAETYARALFGTGLGRTYYPRVEFARMALDGGIAAGEVYEAREEGGELCGLVWFQERGAFHEYPYLHIVVVLDEYQGRGHGRDMLDFFEACALEPGGRRLLRTKCFLVVDEENARARAVYAKRGYTEVGRLPGLYRRNVCELLMQKELARPAPERSAREDARREP